MAVITHDESTAVFSWKCGTLEEYWYHILNALIHPEDDGKCHRPDLIIDDRGYMTLLIHGGKKAEELFIKDGTIPDHISTYCS